MLVSLSFSTNNVCKNAVFFLAVPFPKKAFVFPNNRISEARICRQCWLKKISRKRKTKQQKKLRDNVFLLSPRSHAKIELIWTRKKIRPKKSLTSLLHAALQFPSHTFYCQFLPPSLVALASVCFSIANVVQCCVMHFIFSRPLGYPVSCPLVSCLPYTSCPHYSWIPATLYPSTFQSRGKDHICYYRKSAVNEYCSNFVVCYFCLSYNKIMNR